MKKFHNPLSSTFGVFLGVIAVIAFVWYMQNGAFFGHLTEDVEISSVTLQEILAPASELVTTKKTYTDLDSYESSKDFFGVTLPFTTDKVLFSYSGTINAGIELSEVDYEIDDKNKVITVALPEVKILSHEIDEDSFEFYEVKNSILNELSMEDYTKLRAGLKAKQEEKALADKDFLNEVEENAKDVISTFLTSADATKDYSVRFITKRTGR